MIKMNLINEEICALRSAIEHIDWMISQPQYKDIEFILRARKKRLFR